MNKSWRPSATRSCSHEPVNGIFSAALGDYGYLVRSPDLAEVYEIVDYIHKPA